MKNLFNLFRISAYCLLSVCCFTACEEDDPIDTPDIIVPTSGVFILNQGKMGVNNAGISYYDFNTGITTSDIMNGELGDTAQDILIYGNKIYVSVTESSVIRVLSLDSLQKLKQIEVNDNGVSRKPNYLIPYMGKVYATTSVANSDGNVIRIDTVSLTIDAVAKVGPKPEGIAIVNGKLYVANTNGDLFPDFDKTLSVVDIATFKEESKIEVGLNPGRLYADDYGDIYLSYRGNYGDIPGGFQKLDTKTKAVTDINIPANQDFTILNDTLYYFGVTYNENFSTNCFFGRYDVKTEKAIEGNLISDGTSIATAYALGVDPYNKDIYIADTDYSTPSNIYIFGRDGKKKGNFEAGINAYKFAFK
jgi:hypothetical protein